MKVPFNWLCELVEINVSIQTVAESLSIAGFEVEDIEDYSTRANGVVIGYVEEVQKHPKADKLSICKVNIGNQKIAQIVCGATNVRQDIYVLVATPGAELSAIGLKIKKSELRGIESCGMICSLAELGLQTKCDGIAVLDELYNELPPLGSQVLELLDLNENVIDIAITANRPDGMSMVGIAREVSALLEAKLNIPMPKISQKNELFKPKEIDIAAIDDSGIYTLTRIDNVNGEVKSPKWLSNRLEKSNIKSINAIIDITNFVLLEQGQPLHCFDLDRLVKLTSQAVDSSSFSIRKARASEKLLALDGKEYLLDSNTTIIACHDIPVAIAGVIGGQETSVTKTTKSIILEAAIFTPTSVRKTCRSLGTRTESSSRYEKGISHKLTMHSVNRYIEIIQELFACKPSVTYINKQISQMIKPIELRRERIHKILGSKSSTNFIKFENKVEMTNNYITDEEIVLKLTLLGCKCQTNKDGWNVLVPTYRSLDLIREIDLIEEIARLIGYDKFESNLPIPIKPGGLNNSQQAERRIRKYFVASGFQEITTFSLVSSSDTETDRIPIRNPLLTDTSHLRTNLWEEQLKICQRNITSGQPSCWLFEIGKIYKSNSNKISEIDLLAGSISGKRKFGIWGDKNKTSQLNYFEARGLLQQAIASLKIQLSDEPLKNDKLLHPGRAAKLKLEGKHIGKFGQIHPIKANKYDLDPHTYIFELELHQIIQAAIRSNKWAPRFKSYPTVPYMERDISMIVDKTCSSKEISSLIKSMGKPLLEKVELIDRYEGEKLPEDKVSQAFRIRYRDSKKTLMDSDINPIHERIRSNLISKIGAELRS